MLSKFLWEGNELQVDPMKLHEEKCPIWDMHTKDLGLGA
jgi:hypothetical protein